MRSRQDPPLLCHSSRQAGEALTFQAPLAISLAATANLAPENGPARKQQNVGHPEGSRAGATKETAEQGPSRRQQSRGHPVSSRAGPSRIRLSRSSRDPNNPCLRALPPVLLVNLRAHADAVTSSACGLIAPEAAGTPRTGTPKSTLKSHTAFGATEWLRQKLQGCQSTQFQTHTPSAGHALPRPQLLCVLRRPQ